MKNVFRALSLALAVLALCFSMLDAKNNEPKKTDSIFRFDLSSNKIIGVNEQIIKSIDLKFFSITVDQPTYWPNEDVFLKIIMPQNSSKNVVIEVSKKASTPKKLGLFRLNESGLFVLKIMSGKNKKLELGEYSVIVTSKDKKYVGTASFSVIDGSLGAVSFAHAFKDLTNASEFGKVPGGWIIGNEGGVGSRWGNGLNVKNEVRYLNKPYSGDATVITRCFLPGCDGVEAGPSVITKIIDGKLAAALDISGHSGPFEIEVVTGKGSVKHLFSRSGHVERQVISISQGLSNYFNMTLAPYEDTKQIAGRDIFIAKDKKSENNDPAELKYPVADKTGKIYLEIKKEIVNAKLALFYYLNDGTVKCEEIQLKSTRLRPGQKFEINVNSPYCFLALGGFFGGKMYEGWAIVFNESSIDSSITSNSDGLPNKEIEILIKTFNRQSGRAIPAYGILEVFDTRVLSQSAKEPLASTIGDSARNLSSYILYSLGVRREDTTSSIPATGKVAVQPNNVPGNYKKIMHQAGNISAKFAEKIPLLQVQEDLIREGEKKVVYCGLVKTDKMGTAKIMVNLPPQTGRVTARFVAVSGYDYSESTKNIDVKKKSYVELTLPKYILPGTIIHATCTVFNDSNEKLKLIVTGAGIQDPFKDTLVPTTYNFDIPKGQKECPFDIYGGISGKMLLKLTDKSGNVLDMRRLELNNLVTYPITFSRLIISDGRPVVIKEGSRVAIYSNPASLLSQMAMNIQTTMYSWFGHAEAISASCAVRAALISAINRGFIDDGGLSASLKADLNKNVSVLYTQFYDKNSKLFSPFPGLPTNKLWSVWAASNLNRVVSSLSDSRKLKSEFSDTIRISKEMTDGVSSSLKGDDILKNYIDNDKYLPIEVNGKVTYKLITDDAVMDWYVKNINKPLDIEGIGSMKDLQKRFIVLYDKYRFLKAFERTGPIYYLLSNAKALYLHHNPHFFPLFSRISQGMINTQEPGMIKGPALLGGVYEAPQTFLKFIDLLVLMARKGDVKNKQNIKVTVDNSTDNIEIESKPAVFDLNGEKATIKAPKYCVIRIDNKKNLSLMDYLKNKPFFTAKMSKDSLKPGDEADFVVELAKDRNPEDYYAIIAVPSMMSIRQTEDLLSDYKGSLLYGQRNLGGQQINAITVPFRGSRRIVLNLEAIYKGEGPGFVLVRHMSNPEDIKAINTAIVKVK